MKQGDSNPAGEKSNVRSVTGPHGQANYAVGELNIGGMPCDVVYQGRPASGAVRPASFQVGADGGVAREATGAQTRALARVAPRRVPSEMAVVDHRQALPAVGETDQGSNDLQKLHRLLKGRYLVGCVLALILGAAGVWAGLHFGYQTYQSTGLITLTPIHLFSNGDANTSMLEQFMLAQVAKFKSQRVINAALDDPEWPATIRTPEDEAEFAKELEVTAQGQMLIVKFTHRERDTATVAVRTTTKAFKKLFEQEQADNGLFSHSQWTEARDHFKADLIRIQGLIDVVAQSYGPDGLELQRDFDLEDLRAVQRSIGELEMYQVTQLMMVPSIRKAGPTTQPVAAMTPDDIVRAGDPAMTKYVQHRDVLKQYLLELTSSGMLEHNTKVQSTKLQLKQVEQEIDDRAAEWRAGQIGTMGPVVDATSGTVPMSPQQLKIRLDYLTGRETKIKNDLNQLSADISKIATARIDKERAQSELNVAEKMLDEEEVQRANWRVDVNEPDKPLTPFRDTRITFAAAGGLGGGACGFGLVLLMSLMDRRVRDSHGVGGALDGPVLGMLPQLPEDLADPDQAAAAAHGVHEIRTLLQIWGRGRNHQVFAVTSSAAGSGKTSLTLALGVSFAAAKFRTLLIDCDLVGAGLSTRIDAIIRRKIGQVLTRGGFITNEQLHEALKLARGSGRKLGDILIELGYLTDADLGAAVAMQADEPVGLLDALEGESVADCVAETGIPGLWVLPLGGATARHAGTLSPDALGSVLEAARAHFDVVLVDTGPVPGSLEASLVAAEVDAVVLTVARGEREPSVRRSIAHLRSLGIRLAGVVFNRARLKDMDRYGSSRLSSSRPGAEAETRVVESPESARLGPVARAVASFAPRNSSGSSSRQRSPQ